MSFGKRNIEQPRWLEEDELEEQLAKQGMDKPQSSGLPLGMLLGGGLAVALAFGATFYLMDSGMLG